MSYSDLFSPDFDGKERQNSIARTKVKFENSSFKWVIENFSKYNSDFGHELKSPIFHTCFYLTLKPIDSTDRVFVSIFLNGASTYKVVCEISIIDKAYNKRNAQSFEGLLRNATGFPQFISRHYLFNPENGLLPNDTLTIMCELETAHVTSAIVTTDTLELKTFKPKTLNGIDDDFLAMYTSKKFCDFRIQVGNRTFDVHKVILAARSPMFAAMFEHNMQEKEKNRVLLEDKDPDAVEQAIIYMYTNKCPRIAELASDILEVADYFELKGLREICVDMLVEDLHPENVSSVYILADIHNIKELKTVATNYIKLHLKEVSKTSGWTAVRNNKSWLELAELL